MSDISVIIPHTMLRVFTMKLFMYFLFLMYVLKPYPVLPNSSKIIHTRAIIVQAILNSVGWYEINFIFCVLKMISLREKPSVLKMNTLNASSCTGLSESPDGTIIVFYYFYPRRSFAVSTGSFRERFRYRQ